jgi:hypothetical protein
MKNKKVNRSFDDEMRSEYDFSGGVRGKHFRAYRQGYTVTIHKDDGTTVVKHVKPNEDAVILEPDVRKYFPDSESVNRVLRSFISLIPRKQIVREMKKTSKHQV